MRTGTGGGFRKWNHESGSSSNNIKSSAKIYWRKKKTFPSSYSLKSNYSYYWEKIITVYPVNTTCWPLLATVDILCVTLTQHQQTEPTQPSELLAPRPLKPGCTSPWPVELRPSHTEINSNAVRPVSHAHFHLFFSRQSIQGFNITILEREKLRQGKAMELPTLYTAEPKNYFTFPITWSKCTP